MTEDPFRIESYDELIAFQDRLAAEPDFRAEWEVLVEAGRVVGEVAESLRVKDTRPLDLSQLRDRVASFLQDIDEAIEEGATMDDASRLSDDFGTSARMTLDLVWAIGEDRDD